MSVLQKIRAWLRGQTELARSIDAAAHSIDVKLSAIIEGMDNQSQLLDSKLTALVEGVSNQSQLLSINFERMIEGLNNQSQLLNIKFETVIEGLNNQSQLLNIKFETVIEGLNNQSQLLNIKFETVIEGLNNQSRLLNSKLEGLLQGSANQSRILDERLKAVLIGVENQSRFLNSKLESIIVALENQSRILDPDFRPSSRPAVHVETASAQNESPGPMAAAPLLIAERTYNTSHPDYDINVVRNYTGKILNAALPSNNTIYAELKKLAEGDHIPDEAWVPELEKVLAEAKTNPLTELVLQRREAIEQYMDGLSRRYNARYNPAWVNVEDALFLYWLVRRRKPNVIVQCGVCNGLSSAFMTLALAANGPDGKLYAVDIPPVFNPKDPEWTVPGKVYGHVIPEGKTSGWMVPEAYRKRFELQNGDAKLLLPKLVDTLPAIDIFYHDSDHTYNHMKFEFEQARRKIASGGLIIADDIAWNSALWDFADENKVPAYNFKGAVGVTFF